ncbi:DUF4169 family protein [Gluconacetobacter azotocaptans]|uniref:DUF4169 family protein n=1 Tax=Gluconacetobacter azotocaptans TaxID=142834 RepID=A0A7W4JRW1_9PROT|nr:DUF4169 family protein [Gluconacetobacter azotocaptans]MBB2189782.1 DUF4169 family protein [Gluconacetobacter azotocaptans]MBM9402211.1 DUF4169 family protein [Gluconacetobacter azotocaptans]GBQ37730.1 hypothetical protein AA13594_3567 [Gluconacetobacter azotocaptans DSM 13594]
MAEIVNLRQVRKRKARAGQAQVAAENRALYGRTRTERDRQSQEAARATQTLDGARVEREPDPDPT